MQSIATPDIDTITYALPEVVNYLAMAFLQNGRLQLQYGGHKVTRVTVKLSTH